MDDRPLATTQIIWNPIEDSNLPPVALVSVPREDDSRYISSWGACNIEFVNADSETQLRLLLSKFVYLVLLEGIQAKAVHEAFVQIPEYRRALYDVGAIDPALV